MKILVIEDQADIRDTLKDLLITAGFNVLEAENGEQGLDMMGKHAIDLVISDLNMPGMDGLTMCGHMKEQGYRAPIFMLTTQTSPDLKAKAKDAGVVAWIIKPHKDNVLLDGIRKVLKL